MRRQHAAEASAHQVHGVDECVDHSNGVIFVDPVLKTIWKQRALITADAFDIACHCHLRNTEMILHQNPVFTQPRPRAPKWIWRFRAARGLSLQIAPTAAMRQIAPRPRAWQYMSSTDKRCHSIPWYRPEGAGICGEARGLRGLLWSFCQGNSANNRFGLRVVIGP